MTIGTEKGDDASVHVCAASTLSLDRYRPCALPRPPAKRGNERRRASEREKEIKKKALKFRSHSRSLTRLICPADKRFFLFFRYSIIYNIILLHVRTHDFQRVVLCKVASVINIGVQIMKSDKTTLQSFCFSSYKRPRPSRQASANITLCTCTQYILYSMIHGDSKKG